MLVKRNPIEQRSCPSSFTPLSCCGPHHHQFVHADPYCRDSHHSSRIWLHLQIWEVSTNLEIFLEAFDWYARSDHFMDNITPGRSEKHNGTLRARFPNANCDLTVQQIVDVGLVGRACIPPQESQFFLLSWLSFLLTGYSTTGWFHWHPSKHRPSGEGMARLMLLSLVHHLSDMQGVLLQGCKVKGRHIAEGLVRVSPHLSDKWMCALRCAVCSSAVGNEDNFTGAWQRDIALLPVWIKAAPHMWRTC